MKIQKKIVGGGSVRRGGGFRLGSVRVDVNEELNFL